jgi:translation initiation factor 2-alpha kinase 3
MFERDFEIVGVLGRGGFGEVYDVRKPLDECSYAIKRIRLPRRSKAKERVLREVKALAKLDHPHIIRYYTSWEECPPLGFMYKQLSTEGADTIFSTSEEEITQRESTVATTSHLVSRTEGSSFIQFVDESQQTNYTHNSISDKGLVSDCTDDDIDGETSLGETERNRWSRNNSDSSPVFLYIQMELCHKHTLKDWLADNHTRDYHYVMNIFQQIVSAVAYVHTQGMMHRDLKPSNILFAVNGAVKVGDFGLVKYLAKTPSCNAAMNKETFQSELDYYDSMDNAHITSDVGTELYMSPEQVAGKPYCEKVDVFSMGVILFELLTPFTTQMERHQTLIRVRSRQFPQSFEEQYPKEHGLTCSLLAEFPDNRPSAQNIKNHSLLDPFKGH